MLLTTDKSALLLKHLFGQGDGTASTTNPIAIGMRNNCWLGVLLTDPVATGTFSEPDASKNYSRVEIHGVMSTTFGSGSGQVPILPDFTYPDTNAEARRIGNFADINFNCAYPVSDPTAASGGAWGDIKGFALYTSQTGGTPYAFGKLIETVTVDHKNTLHFLKGRLVVYMDDDGNTAAAAQGNT